VNGRVLPRTYWCHADHDGSSTAVPLGGHRALDAAVVGLRRGQPYVFAVSAPEGAWSWAVRPVSALPMAKECTP